MPALEFCPLCFGSSDDHVELFSCTHQFCLPCIKLYLADLVERRKSTYLRCPMGDCEEEISVAVEFRKWANFSTISMYNYLMTKMITKMRCGVCKTRLDEVSEREGLMDVLKGKDVWVRCPKCFSSLCSRCGDPKYANGEMHDTEDCEYDSDSDTEMANPYMIRRIDDQDEQDFLKEARIMLMGPHVFAKAQIPDDKQSAKAKGETFGDLTMAMATNSATVHIGSRSIDDKALSIDNGGGGALPPATDDSETRNETADQKAASERQKVTRCPVCGHCVWRDDGCAHIICVCEHEFCFYCRKPWDFRGSEQKNWHRRRCPVRRHEDTYVKCRFPCVCDDVSDDSSG